MKTVKVPHQLDSMFSIMPGQTEVMLPGSDIETDTTAVTIVTDGQLVEVEDNSTQLTAIESYDGKDDEIEGQLDDVRVKAIEAYETMLVASQTIIDKKFASENAEVAASFLQIALNAVKEKNNTKDRKDKIVLARSKGTPAAPQKNITNNIVTDRATMLQLLKDSNGSQ